MWSAAGEEKAKAAGAGAGVELTFQVQQQLLPVRLAAWSYSLYTKERGKTAPGFERNSRNWGPPRREHTQVALSCVSVGWSNHAP